MAFIRWATVATLIAILPLAAVATIYSFFSSEGLAFLIGGAITIATWQAIQWMHSRYPD